MSNAYLDELVKQKAKLATILNNKGVTASESETFNTLIPKVNQIDDEINAEEKIVNNISSISTSSQLMRLNYPDNTDKTITANVRSVNFIDGTLWSTPTTQNGVTVQYLADEDCFLLNGTCTTTMNLAIRTMNVPVSSGTSITVTKYVSGTVTIPGGGYAVMHIDGVNKFNYRACKNFRASDTASTLSNMTADTINQARFYITQGVVFDNYKVKIAFYSNYQSSEYIPHKYSVKLTSSGKNLIHYPYVNTSYTNNGITYTVNDDGTITANGTFTDKTISSFVTLTGNSNSSQSLVKLPLGYNYVVSGSPVVEGISTQVRYCNLSNGRALDNAKADDGNTKTFTAATDVSIPGVQISLKSNGTVSTITNAVFKPMIQYVVDSTENHSVEYEKGSAITYTPDENGDVTNIPAHSPKTILYTNVDDSAVIMSVTSGAYKEILPSADKNCINPLWQEIVGSNIDANIKPENIRKGYTILGVTGTME